MESLQRGLYYSFSCGEIAENAERVFNEMLQKKERPSAFIIPANLTRYLKRAVRANNLYILMIFP
ncbi:MAG: hypothetical protein V8Q93_12200 [Blautia faecis]